MHIANAAQVALKFLELFAEHSLLFLGKGCHAAIFYHCLKLFHAVDTRTHSHKVGEHTTQPALIDVRHATTLSLFAHRLLSLLLCTYKENATALACAVLEERVRFVGIEHGLLEIENVNAVTLAKDIWFHLGVPAAGLVTIVATSLEERTDIDLYSHNKTSIG